MILVQLTGRVINLHFMIQAVDSPDDPESIRVRVVPGDEFDAVGEDARRIRAWMDRLARPYPPPPAGGDATAPSYDPVTGEPSAPPAGHTGQRL